jgi:formylglycine-generating enzyme required for sulfatase activity
MRFGIRFLRSEQPLVFDTIRETDECAVESGSRIALPQHDLVMDPITIGIITLVVTGVGIGIAGLGVHYNRKQYLATQKRDDPEKPKSVTEAAHSRSLPPPETQTQNLAAYKKWLRSETLYIDIRGIAVGAKGGRDAITFPINDLYAELYVQKGPTNLDADDGKIRKIRLTDLVENTRCSLITGDPGAGKTTFLRYLAQKKLTIPSYKYDSHPDEVLPIFIYLPDLYRHLSKTFSASNGDSIPSHLASSTLIDFVVALSDKHGWDLTAHGLATLISDGRIFWLLDSLDELTAADSREAIVELLSNCSRQFDRCSFAVTSRPLVVKGKSIPVDFQVVNIDYMEPEEIRSFLEKWFSLLYPEKAPAARLESSNRLFDKIINTPHLRLLAKNPVMLTSVAVLDYNSMALPERKVDLLEAIISWLITAKSRDSGDKPSGFKQSIYSRLALRMFEHPNGRQVQVGKKWAASIISEYFESEDSALEFLSKEENETGLLVQRGEGDLAFWLTWFQEYLAAKEIVDNPDMGPRSWWAKIRNRLDDPDWHEVLSMIPACLNRLGSHRVNMFFERLGKSCEKCDFQSQIRRVGFGGHILRDLFFNEYRLADAPKWVAALENVASIFADTTIDIDLRDKYEAAAAIGQMGRKGSDADRWLSLEGGEFLLGAQADDPNSQNYDKDAFDWEKPVMKVCLKPFQIQRTPTSVQQFADFVNSGGYAQRELWTVDGWAWRVMNKIKAPLDWQTQLLIPNCPVTGISWFEALAYCEWLSRNDSGSARYSLPSEAQWEFSYKSAAGERYRFSWGMTLSRGNNAEANWLGCGLRKKSPIGMFPKSTTERGLVDMIGNVEEWCLDNWSPDHSGYDVTGGARVVTDSTTCIVRGGSTIRPAKHCRPTYRSRTNREKRYQTIGFRVATLLSS